MRSRIVTIGLIILGILIVAAIAFAIFGGGDKNTPAQTAYRQAGDQFMSYLTDNDANKSYAMLSDNMKAQFSKEQWTKMVDDSFKGGNEKAVFAGEGNLQNEGYYPKGSNPHLLTYTTVFDGVKWKTSFVVFKKNNVWRIDSMGSVSQ